MLDAISKEQEGSYVVKIDVYPDEVPAAPILSLADI